MSVLLAQSWRALLALSCLAAVLAWGPAEAHAQAPGDLSMPFGAAPFQREVRLHYYEKLSRSPGKALLWDLALPGAGSLYTGLYVNTIISASVSVLGASLWIAGAAKDHDGLWWAGMATFCAGRAYGLVSAPIGAGLLNAAFRRQLGLTSPAAPGGSSPLPQGEG